jgi:hypothetical protein
MMHKLVAISFLVSFGALSLPAQQVPAAIPAPAIPTSSANDAARYLAGMPVAVGSTIEPLTRDPQWIAHSNAMNDAFAKLFDRQLNNIEPWRAQLIAPIAQFSRNCFYFFSGPDFLYADIMFPDCSTYVLVGLESVDPMPELLSLPQPALHGTLQNIEIALNSVLNFSFFQTKEMRQDFSRGALKGVLPILFVFMARLNKEIQEVSYISLDRNGSVRSGRGGTRGIRITYGDLGRGTRKQLYFFTADLANDALRKNPAVLQFCNRLAPANSLLKAASYLPHENGFSTIRDYIVQTSALILQDDSGIPIRYLPPDRWSLRFFGSYQGPIELFKQFYQPDLQRYYAASAPKPLTFGFGYHWNANNSSVILAVRKD